ncbi:hypothetical protein AGLY_002262 [Aphis glycines]|uniref:Uncharacterized protein n=1 Tax=Aphis glycines TaxID=307491 RepID=A0A6G0U5A6_APHGL|nr:hypothetical protein AGLY_002262 [Aphis glycines]
MGDPPSSFGGIHFKSTKFLSQSVTSKLPELPKGFLAIIDSSVWSGSDSPSAFTAVTRNLYSLPGVRPVTAKAVKRVPPSSSGLFQFNLQPSLSGPTGGVGLSVTVTLITAVSFPELFTAETVYCPLTTSPINMRSWFTLTWFGYKTSTWPTRLTLTSFVYGNDAELIFVTFNQTINNSLRLFIDLTCISGSLVRPTGNQTPLSGSNFSTKYPSNGSPPSSFGFFHFKVHPSLCTSETSNGPSGLLVEILTLLNDQVTSGAGSPDTLTSYKIGSPSRIWLKGTPPSSSGGFHFNEAPSLCISDILIGPSVGGGSPLIFTSIFTCCPAFKVKFLSVLLSIIGATKALLKKKYTSMRIIYYTNIIPFLSFVITGSLGSLGLLNPPLLTAITRKVYFIFSARSGTLPSHLFPINSTAFCHLELKRIVSPPTCVTITGAPFSFAGGVHFKCTLLLSQSLAYGFPGRSATIPKSVSKGSDSPSAFTAFTRNKYSLPSCKPVTSASGSLEMNKSFNPVPLIFISHFNNITFDRRTTIGIRSFPFKFVGFGLPGLLVILPNGFLATINLSASRSSDSPSLLTALTRNLYCLPSCKPVMLASGSLDLPHGIHWPVNGSTSLNDHVTVGTGSPLIFTSINFVCPTFMTKLCKFVLSILASIEASDSNGSDSPSSFNAFTLKLYFLFGSRPFILCSVFAGSTNPAGTHFPVVVSIFSTKYPVMGNPPSSLGLFQCSVQPSLCTSVTSSGPTGGPVIGAPPSCFGSVHDKSTLSTSQSVIFGVPAFNVHFWLLCAANWNPAPSLSIHFFNHVRCYGFSTIVLWFVPFDFSPTACNIFHFKRTLSTVTSTVASSLPNSFSAIILYKPESLRPVSDKPDCLRAPPSFSGAVHFKVTL